MSTRTNLPSWQKLEALANERGAISAQFREDPHRADNFCSAACGIRLDYSKTAINAAVREQLLTLAEDCKLASMMQAMRHGDKINSSEQRAVLHIALRDRQGNFAADYGSGIYSQVQEQLANLARISEAVRNGQWRGHTGKSIRQVVNIGIGGSDLGPRMVCDALRDYNRGGPKAYFASNVDETHLPTILQGLNPEETLFSISSKTFTTQETMCNARLARAWLMAHYQDDSAIAAHCIAVTSNVEAATEFGIDAANLLSFWEWVGGRFSLWSTIGFPIAAALGYERFCELLDGAHDMDQHFFSAEWAENLPILLALAGIWHNNFCGYHTLGVIPYNDALSLLPMYLQQLDMESNGKSIDRDGLAVDYATGPVLWGQNGSNGQHAFFQSLHQGTQVVPLEIVFALHRETNNPQQHRILLANLFAQSNAFMAGQPAAEGEPYTEYPGDKPNIVVALDELTPRRLGALVALYEHKIFVQGVVWNINSFDQWGVQLGKRLANEIGTDFSNPPANLDPGTLALIAWVDHQLTK